VSRTAKPTAKKIGIKTGNIDTTHKQSKARFTPDCDQGLSRFPDADRVDFDTSQSFFEGRGRGDLSPASGALRCEDRFILVVSEVSGTYDLVLTMTLHKRKIKIGL
jgi:hypothetical protein